MKAKQLDQRLSDKYNVSPVSFDGPVVAGKVAGAETLRYVADGIDAVRVEDGGKIHIFLMDDNVTVLTYVGNMDGRLSCDEQAGSAQGIAERVLSRPWESLL